MTGIAIFLVGVALLLSQLGLFHIEAIWRFWPALFILVGITKLVEATALSQRIWGGMLAVIGALLLAHYFGHFRYGIDQIWPLFIIGAGLSLVFQTHLNKEAPYAGAAADGAFRSMNVFGGTDRKFRDQNFRGGRAFACFGGFQLDFTQTEMEGDHAVIEATAVFGGGEIRVPLNWNVIVEGTGIFGGYEDSTQHIAIEGKPTKTLIVRGAAVFGGVEVKN